MNVRMAQRMAVTSGRVDELRRRVRPVVELVRGPGAMFPWGETYPFGLGLLDDVATIYPGDICIGADLPVSILTTTRTITADLQYLAAEYDWSAGTLAIGSPTTTKPVSDELVFRAWLYQFRLVSGVATLHKIGNAGQNLLLPANYAK